MTSCAWLWLYAGAFLMLLELFAPGFVIFFFGLAAAGVGLMRFAFGEAFDATWQIASFSVFSVLFLALLRRWLKNVFMGKEEKSVSDFENQYLGRIGKVTKEIDPPLPGRVLLGDLEWSAIADEAIAKDANVKVISQNNLTMKVEVIK